MVHNFLWAVRKHMNDKRVEHFAKIVNQHNLNDPKFQEAQDAFDE